jgi:hypothetical protein
VNFDAQTLYDLLPAIYRIRDAEQRRVLKDLLTVIAEQVAAIEEDLDQLYDDLFIETCAEWVVPYIGDLVGYRALHGVAPDVKTPRAEVANTIALRRRKGTAAALEELADSVTGWPARVVEFYRLLAVTQYMNHLRLSGPSTVDLRDRRALEYLDTPFDRLAHTADVRHIASRRGRHNIPNVGIFLWRLDSYPLSGSPAFRVDARRFLFSPLGTNLPLHNRVKPEETITHIAEPVNVPMPISRRVLHADLKREKDQVYYGKDKYKSLWIEVDGEVMTADRIEVCDLSDTDPDPETSAWAHQAKTKIAVDPVLGRIAFPQDIGQDVTVRVSFHYGFSAAMGGGEYDRGPASEADLKVPDQHATVQEALDVLAGSGTVEIVGSGRYSGALEIVVARDGQLVLRAADSSRPTLVLGEELPKAPAEEPIEELIISGGASGEVTLEGLLICGGRLRVPAEVDGLPNRLQRLRLRHCTLVPGLALTRLGKPRRPDLPSLVVETANTVIEIDHCIVGGLRVARRAEVRISNSILDAMATEKVAYSGLDGNSSGGTLEIRNCTVIGRVWTLTMKLASNTIFLASDAAEDSWPAPVVADQRQQGCVRFSYLPLESLVPRRYYCQPRSVEDATRVRPQFTSLRYGDAGYCQLSAICPVEIWQGADDEVEMGAFHNLYQPQRETNLRVRLREYLRFGLEAGIFYVS